MEILKYRGIEPEIKKTMGRFWAVLAWEFSDDAAGGVGQARGIECELRAGESLPDLKWQGDGEGDEADGDAETSGPVDFWDAGGGDSNRNNAGGGIWVSI